MDAEAHVHFQKKEALSCDGSGLRVRLASAARAE